MLILQKNPKKKTKKKKKNLYPLFSTTKFTLKKIHLPEAEEDFYFCSGGTATTTVNAVEKEIKPQKRKKIYFL
jgi:hypothetical protein